MFLKYLPKFKNIAAVISSCFTEYARSVGLQVTLGLCIRFGNGFGNKIAKCPVKTAQNLVKL